MSRITLLLAGTLSATTILLVDSAVKGAVPLLLAAAVALWLRRDSAATRHLVWLVAIVASVSAPLLSVVLPAWRVLPTWTAYRAPEVVAVQDFTSPAPPVATTGPFNPPHATEVPSFETAAAPEPIAAAASDVTPGAESSRNRRWLEALPLLWAAGFVVFLLRLVVARRMLAVSERDSVILATSSRAAKASHDPLVRALDAACEQLRLDRPVTLLIREGRAIPLVWGIFRPRLMLPAAARGWSAEQLRSVLLHELAHVKRHDAITQLAVQLACAVHWLNPLVWFAAWRLGVERERACDDLVLASGVRPSAYAGHLLDIATGFTAVCWTQWGGLAMARQSSLEGRLVAVLNKNVNRREVSLVLASIAMAIAVGIAAPIAMLRAAEEPAKQEEAVKAQTGVPLKAESEQKLKWGEPSNGLRMALAWPPTLDEPALGKAPEYRLAVQNVSESAIRLTISAKSPNPRSLVMRKHGQAMQSLSDDRPTPGDWLLQPREVVWLPLFQFDEAKPDQEGQLSAEKLSTTVEEDIRVFPQYSVTAVMSIANPPQGAWHGELSTGESRGSLDVVPPKDKSAQALYQFWMNAARVDGKIPGALIGQLAESVRTFIKNNPTWETTPQLVDLLPRFDATHDWSGADAVALLDALAELQDTPIAMAVDHEQQGIIHTGTPLPHGLENAPWGETLPNGLRHAWYLTPPTAEHRLGESLKARVLIHNAGSEPVVFRTRGWHQLGHQAHDAQGAEIAIESTSWLTRGQLTVFRLAPGEFIEVNAPGIGIGPMGNPEDWQQTGVGSWVLAKAGEEVTLTTSPLPLNDWNESPDAQDGEPRWWLDFITARLSRHLPFPPDQRGRELLLYRVAMELFGTPVGGEFNSAFVADMSPNALRSLAERLFHRQGQFAWAGPLTSGPTKFKVLPADPQAALRPRTAVGPGHYTINDHTSLDVTRRPVGERIVNEAALSFGASDPAIPSRGEPLEIDLPDGYDTWTAAWVRGTNLLWLGQSSGRLLRYDVTDPASVKIDLIKVAGAEEAEPIPPEIRETLQEVLRQVPANSDPPASPPRP